MPSRNLFALMTMIASFFLPILFGFATPACAQQEAVLVNMNLTGTSGAFPQDTPTLDAAGNIYLSATSGGTTGGGTVFKASRDLNGTWTETVLHYFPHGAKDGDWPYGQLVFDAAGNLYGTTRFGGAYNDAGTVFELSPASVGWKEKILHSFGSGNDGANPFVGVVFDAAGNLYGTTTTGGSNNLGTVFELSPTAGGGWKETILHDFKGSDGEIPFTRVTLDAAGNLYGTTTAGGPTADAGVVFKLSRKPGGGWAYSLVHTFSFGTTDGEGPFGDLVIDRLGSLYGTTTGGGSHVQGMVYKLIPGPSGKWKEESVHDFENGTDGEFPYAGVALDEAGNLYGMVTYGGAYQNGVVYKLTPDGRGNWTETILHAFDNNGIDGYAPSGTVALDAQGNLYGATDVGGAYGYGTVVEITP
jgi:uncharacterized repeat protein (TIGR03803 family)